MVEIIYNPKLEPKNQYIDLSTIFLETLFFLPSGVTVNNQNHLSFAAHNGYFIMTSQDYDNLVAVLSCPYKSYIDGGGTSCKKCEGKSAYQVTDYTCYSCENTGLVPSYLQERFDYMCENDEHFRPYNPFILVFAVFGAILFTLMCCICIIVLKLKGLICVGRGPIGQEVLE